MDGKDLQERELKLRVEEKVLTSKIETIMALMSRYKITTVEVDGIKLEKHIHDDPILDEKPNNTNIDEDLLYYSSGEKHGTT